VRLGERARADPCNSSWASHRVWVQVACGWRASFLRVRCRSADGRRGQALESGVNNLSPLVRAIISTPPGPQTAVLPFCTLLRAFLAPRQLTHREGQPCSAEIIIEMWGKAATSDWGSIQSENLGCSLKTVVELIILGGTGAQWALSSRPISGISSAPRVLRATSTCFLLLLTPLLDLLSIPLDCSQCILPTTLLLVLFTDLYFAGDLNSSFDLCYVVLKHRVRYSE